jgi:hypothetical protein
MHISKLFVKTLLLNFFSLSILYSQTFTDVSHLLKPDFPIGVRTGQRGASAADFNNDGLVDIYHANFRDPGRLYLNQGDSGFIDILQLIELDEGENMWGAAFGDYNHDGYLDIIFEDLSEPSKIYRNNREGTFTEANDSVNVLVNTLAQGAAWDDFNLDGNLDFFIVNDVGPNQLFKNIDRKVYQDISISANVQTFGNSYGVSWGDINNDGYPDAYIATCHPVDPLRSINHLLLNNGDETFTNIGQSAGVADSLAGWGVIIFDYDHDFDMDIFVTNSFHDPRPGFNRLYRNEGNNVFTDVSFAAGVAGGILEDSYGVAAADFDNDGWTDLYITDLAHRDRLYHNNGDGTFIDVSLASGILDNEHRAVAVADFNNDGWIDIFTAGTPQNRLMYNIGGSNHWLRVRARGINSTYFGVGAKIAVYCDTLHQIQTIRAGDSFCSQNHDLSVHFGLGEFFSIDSLTITWPGGFFEKFMNISPVDQEITIVEGVGINHRPSSFTLLEPMHGDTLYNTTQDVKFKWSKATDPDAEPLTYTLYLTGEELITGIKSDTIISGITDTTIFISNNFFKNNHSYRWSVDANDGYLIIACTNASSFTYQISTGIISQNEFSPSKFNLRQNYPNPFNPETTITYEIPLTSEVKIVVFNILGEQIRVIADNIYSPGVYSMKWDGTNQEGHTVASGIYIYKLINEQYTMSKKMVLLR